MAPALSSRVSLMVMGLVVVEIALVASSVQAAPEAPAASFEDYVSSILLPQSSSSRPSSNTRASSYQEQQRICLKEQQLSYCGRAEFSGVSTQSDFTCCHEHDHHYDQDQDLIGYAAPSMSVGNCLWEYTYMTISGPVIISDTLIRAGSLNAICRLGSNIDQCGGPEGCDKLLVSLSGDMYFTLARSHERTYYHVLGPGETFLPGPFLEPPEPGETCCEILGGGFPDGFEFNFAGDACCSRIGQYCNNINICSNCCDCDNPVGADCAECCADCDLKKANTTAAATTPATRKQNKRIQLEERLQARQARNAKKHSTPAKRHTDIDGSQFYVGEAMIAMGTATIVNAGHDRHTKVEPVGTFEYVLNWDTNPRWVDDTSYTESSLHWVRPGTFELTWTREEAAQYKA